MFVLSVAELIGLAASGSSRTPELFMGVVVPAGSAWPSTGSRGSADGSHVRSVSS